MMVMFAVALFSVNAQAETLKMIGTVYSFKISDDQKTVTAVVKDNKTEQNVTIVITDEATVEKFKDHIIKMVMRSVPHMKRTVTLIRLKFSGRRLVADFIKKEKIHR